MSFFHILPSMARPTLIWKRNSLTQWKECNGRTHAVLPRFTKGRFTRAVFTARVHGPWTRLVWTDLNLATPTVSQFLTNQKSVWVELNMILDLGRHKPWRRHCQYLCIHQVYMHLILVFWHTVKHRSAEQLLFHLCWKHHRGMRWAHGSAQLAHYLCTFFSNSVVH